MLNTRPELRVVIWSNLAKGNSELLGGRHDVSSLPVKTPEQAAPSRLLRLRLYRKTHEGDSFIDVALSFGNICQDLVCGRNVGGISVALRTL